MRVSPSVLVAVSAVALPLALTAPLYSLLLLDILLVPLQGQTQIGGVLLDQTDLIFGILAVGILLRQRLSLRELRRQIPYFWLWLSLGTLMSIAYVVAPLYQQHLTAFHRGVYQVYRAAWKPILYFPLAALLLNTAERSRQALIAVVLAGDICALMALPEGLQGLKAEGPFSTGNSLGAALIVPFVVSFGMLISTRSRRARWFYGLSFLLLGRVLLFAGSRGAIAGAIAGVSVVLWLLFSHTKGRARLLRLLPAALVALLLLFSLKPDLLNRPTVRRALTLSSPMEESTMQWRIENRWSFFWPKALRSPWFGYGIDVDQTLSQKGGAMTPHNGYLSLLVTYGFPASIIYVLFGVLGIWKGIRAHRRFQLNEVSNLGLLAAAGIAGILTHNLGESLFTTGKWVNSVYWLLAALGAMALSEMSEKSVPAEDPSTVGPEVATVEKGLAA